MKNFMILFALAFATGLNAQKFPTTIGDSVMVFHSNVSGVEFLGCLSQVQVVPGTICAGNSATLTASLAGGGTPSNVKWFLNGVQIGSGLSITVSPQFQTNYYVEVTCPDGSLSIVEPTVYVNGMAPALSFTTTPANCGSGGSIDLTVTGGAAPFTYFWTNAATTQDIANVSAGTYTVTVVSSVGCTKSGSATVNSNGNNFTATISANGPTSFCQGGSVILTASPAQTYMWSNGATTQSVIVFGSGNYSVVETNNGCTATSNVISINVNPLPNASISGPTSVCLGSSAILTASGGVSYSWSGLCQNGSTVTVTPTTTTTYTVTVTNANGCTATTSHTLVVNSLPSPVIMLSYTGGPNVALTAMGGFSYMWSNATPVATTNVLTNGGTTYTVTVTNTNGCTATSAVVPNITPCQSGPACNLTASTGVTNLSCFGSATGSATVTPSGGSGYTYKWSNGNTNATISGLTAGSYTVTVTDANNCKVVANATVSQPSAISIATVTGNGSVSLAVSGGVSNYTYWWNNTATTQNLINLTAGTYCVTVTDANGCTSAACATVNAGNPTCNLTVATTVMDATCNGCNNGSVWATVSNGTGPLTYHWSNGANSPDISNLVADNYCVTVTDANGCVAIACANVNQPPAGCNPVGITNNMGLPNGGSFCPSTSQFFLTAPGNWANDGYLWSDPSLTIDAWRILAPTGNGLHTYSVWVYPNGQIDDGVQYCFEYTINCMTGTSEERGPEPEISVYPNPTKGEVNVDLTSQPAGTYGVTVTNLATGQLVTKKIVKQ